MAYAWGLLFREFSIVFLSMCLAWYPSCRLCCGHAVDPGGGARRVARARVSFRPPSPQSFSLSVVLGMTYTLWGISVVNFEVSSSPGPGPRWGSLQLSARPPSWCGHGSLPPPKNPISALGPSGLGLRWSFVPLPVSEKIALHPHPSPLKKLDWRHCGYVPMARYYRAEKELVCIVSDTFAYSNDQSMNNARLRCTACPQIPAPDFPRAQSRTIIAQSQFPDVAPLWDSTSISFIFNLSVHIIVFLLSPILLCLRQSRVAGRCT